MGYDPDLPTEAVLGPFRYVISEDPAQWEASEQDIEQAHGYTDHQRGYILIHPNTTPDFKRVVLMHELMHAAVFCSGQVYNRKRKEEAWVIATAPMLLDALQRSPALLEYLIGVEA